MKLKLPSEGQADEHFPKARFPRKSHSKKANDQLDISGKVAQLSVQATLFNEGTLKNLLKEKSSLSQLEQSLGEKENNVDDLFAAKKTVIFKSKRLQSKQYKKHSQRRIEGVEAKKLPKVIKDKSEESMGVERENKEDNHESEVKGEIEGLYKIVRIVIQYSLYNYSTLQQLGGGSNGWGRAWWII